MRMLVVSVDLIRDKRAWYFSQDVYFYKFDLIIFFICRPEIPVSSYLSMHPLYIPYQLP